ncbi:hypothetical protein AYO45_05305 [Gammaproteobacteria bacterium SCGC AG-212-F23]|nr:hypothetical protein AYO45_05305 [Gammaproteobacteria bacterium SCGC AG-212-F23]
MLKRILISLLIFTFPLTVFAVQTLPDKGTVTLTFDDGPSPKYTPQILAILKKYNIKATFFVVGASAKKYPELVREIIAEGHAVGNHSWSHPMLTRLSNTQLQHEVVDTQNAVEKAIGKKPVCLRPPYGMANPHVKDYIRSQGIAPVAMGFNSFDYERRGTEKMVDWVLKNVHAGQVILMHDGYDKREQTVEALPRIIEGIQKKGLGFSAICYS